MDNKGFKWYFKKYNNLEEEIKEAKDKIRNMRFYQERVLEEVTSEVVKGNFELRPMNKDDLVCGNIVIGVDNYHDEYYCHVIEEVLSTRGIWKNFVAEDGCRYGLDGSYIIVE